MVIEMPTLDRQIRLDVSRSRTHYLQLFSLASVSFRRPRGLIASWSVDSVTHRRQDIVVMAASGLCGLPALNRVSELIFPRHAVSVPAARTFCTLPLLSTRRDVPGSSLSVVKKRPIQQERPPRRVGDYRRHSAGRDAVKSKSAVNEESTRRTMCSALQFYSSCICIHTCTPQSRVLYKVGEGTS